MANPKKFRIGTLGCWWRNHARRVNSFSFTQIYQKSSEELWFLPRDFDEKQDKGDLCCWTVFWEEPRLDNATTRSRNSDRTFPAWYLPISSWYLAVADGGVLLTRLLVKYPCGSHCAHHGDWCFSSIFSRTRTSNVSSPSLTHTHLTFSSAKSNRWTIVWISIHLLDVCCKQVYTKVGTSGSREVVNAGQTDLGVLMDYRWLAVGHLTDLGWYEPIESSAFYCRTKYQGVFCSTDKYKFLEYCADEKILK